MFLISKWTGRFYKPSARRRITALQTSSVVLYDTNSQIISSCIERPRTPLTSGSSTREAFERPTQLEYAMLLSGQRQPLQMPFSSAEHSSQVSTVIFKTRLIGVSAHFSSPEIHNLRWHIQCWHIIHLSSARNVSQLYIWQKTLLHDLQVWILHALWRNQIFIRSHKTVPDLNLVNQFFL